jgi:hypothetical protein
VAETKRKEGEAFTGKEAKKIISDALDVPPNSDATRALAEDLPEKDEVQKATKAAMLADSPKQEVAEKVKVVKASPDSEDTPSGHAMIKVAGVSNNIERGEKYLREKNARRWNTYPADE